MENLTTSGGRIDCALTKEHRYPNASSYTDARGKKRWRYRKKGVDIPLGTDYGSDEFERRYAAAVKGERLVPGETTARASQAPNGSLSAVIESWYTSPDFLRCADSTRHNYRLIADKLREEHGHRRVAGITRAVVKKLMAKKASTPAAANSLLRVLRHIFDHAVQIGLIQGNPARSVKRYQINSEGFYTWTEEDIQKYVKKHEKHSVADVVMHLMLYTGAGRAEVVKLGPRNITMSHNGPRLHYLRSEAQSCVGVDIPVHPDLWKRIEPLMQRGTFLQTQYGKQRSAPGLGNLMRKACDEAGLPEASAYGLRKACRRRLVEAGLREQEVSAVLGFVDTNSSHPHIGMGNRATLGTEALKSLV